MKWLSYRFDLADSVQESSELHIYIYINKEEEEERTNILTMSGLLFLSTCGL